MLADTSIQSNYTAQCKKHYAVENKNDYKNVTHLDANKQPGILHNLLRIVAQ